MSEANKQLKLEARFSIHDKEGKIRPEIKRAYLKIRGLRAEDAMAGFILSAETESCQMIAYKLYCAGEILETMMQRIKEQEAERSKQPRTDWLEPEAKSCELSPAVRCIISFQELKTPEGGTEYKAIAKLWQPDPRSIEYIERRTAERLYKVQQITEGMNYD